MKRREFVFFGSLATTGALAGISAFGRPILPNDKFNLGIIGTGSRGVGLMKRLNEIAEINITACCDILPFRLEKGLATTTDKAKGYEDYRKLLEDKNVDAVLIAVPFGLHAEVAMAALDAGKHVYCEKTMTRGYEDTIALAKKVKSSGKIFQTGHQYHSSRMYSEVAQRIREGMAGEITAIHSQWNRNADWRRPVPDPRYERQINWRMYNEYSGGLIAELCAHQIDFANWVLEEIPETVMGTGGIDHWKDGRETFDNIHLIHGYPSGVEATYCCTTTNSMNDYQIKVLGDKGTVILGYDQAWFMPEKIVEKEIGNVDGVSGATVSFVKEKGYEIKVDHKDPSLQALLDFRDSVLNNKTPISNVITGGHVSMVVQMSRTAVHQKTVEQWKKEYNLSQWA